MTKFIAAPFWWLTGLIFGYRLPEPRVPTVPYFDESHLTNRPGAVIRVSRRRSKIIEGAWWVPPP